MLEQEVFDCVVTSHSFTRILCNQLHRLLYLPSYIAALLFLVEMKASNTWLVNIFLLRGQYRFPVIVLLDENQIRLQAQI